MYLHGHNMWAFSSGPGVSIMDPQNPHRRDTHKLAPNEYMVMQYNAEITERRISQVMAQTCTDWNVWTSKNVVDQIDSDVKERRVFRSTPELSRV